MIIKIIFFILHSLFFIARKLVFMLPCIFFFNNDSIFAQEKPNIRGYTARVAQDKSDIPWGERGRVRVVFQNITFEHFICPLKPRPALG